MPPKTLRPWSLADIPSQAGRLALVTGTGGLGYEIALALVQAGAEVILAGRNENKGLASVEKIKSLHSGARIVFGQLDLAELTSVTEFCALFARTRSALDLLINNAAVMSVPTRRITSDGFELQFATNYLGHFALTGRLLPFLQRGSQPRVVQVSGNAHLTGAIHFEDLQAQHNYNPRTAYCQSKLAQLLFALELQRRSNALGWNLLSSAAHPGYALTNLIANGPGPGSLFRRTVRAFLRPLTSHSAAAGALPILYAATEARVKGGDYFGPQGRNELNGPPGPAYLAPQAQDPVIAKKLWEVSENLTGFHWPTS